MSTSSVAASKDSLEQKEDVKLPSTTSEQSSRQSSEESAPANAGRRTAEETSGDPPLPVEEPPPLPNKAAPGVADDDGWAPVWDETAQAFFFYNRFTYVTQWENPRVPEASQPPPPGVGNYDRIDGASNDRPSLPVAGGYDPAIHGDYDPNADYAKLYESSQYSPGPENGTSTDPAQRYVAAGAFNRFTGKWQAADLNPEKFNDENKSRRQMNAFFDVDAAANSHDGKSLKAERSGKKLSKQELKAFKEKRREKKEERRRAWLRD